VSSAVRSRLANGLADSGLASAATFAAALFAARMLPPDALGAYALVFAAFVTAAIVPMQLVFVPAEVVAVAQPDGTRMRLLGRTLRLGLPITIVAAAGIALWLIARPPGLRAETAMPLTVSAIAAAIVSPAQDHLRRMLHLAGDSMRAAAVSVVQLVAVVASIGVAWRAGVPAPWVPFGALACANVVSLGSGLAFVRGATHGAPTVLLERRSLFQAGRWLTAVGLLPTGAAFLAGAIVAHVAGPEVLGMAEAARVAGQPMMVFTIGISAVLGPQSMRAAQIGDVRAARRIAREFALLVAAAGIAYVAFLGHAWALNPMAALVPQAFVLPGIVALTVLANTAQGVVFPWRSELLGAARNATLAGVELVAGIVRIAVAGAAGVLGAFAIPGGLALVALTRAAAYPRILADHYALADFGGTHADPRAAPPVPAVTPAD
jgi:O-antigen/teichoic acid export membrane protein